MPSIKVGPPEGLAWIACGWNQVRHNPELWLGMALVYFLIALALKLIPFMGNLVLILISPLLLAGALTAARANPAPGSPPPAAAARSEKLRYVLSRYLQQPARQLFQLCTREDKVFSLIIVCILALGLVMVVGIAEYLLTGGSIISGLTSSKLAAPLRPMFVIGMVIVVTLYVLLAMSVFFVVPLTLFQDREPMAALAESFLACHRNALALLLFATLFFLPYLAILLVFSVSHWLGYLLSFSVGFLLLPTFIAGSYCSYQALYPPAPVTPFSP